MRTLREIPITLGPDGLYHAKVTVGRKANGRPDRRHRSGTTEEAVREKLRDLLREVDAGRTPRAGRTPTVAQWFTTWLTDVAPTGARALAPRTLEDYRSALRTWIGPHVGHLRLDGLEPDHLQAMYAAMYRAGTSPARVQKIHAIVRRGLEFAVRWRKAPRNVAREMDPPGYGETARESLTIDEVRSVLAIAHSSILPYERWMLGMAIGPRQGETLGLRWSDVDLDAGTVSIAWQLQRRTWQHGCTGCGRKRGADCPSRHLEVRRDEIHLGGGLVLCRPKGWRRRPRPRVVGISPDMAKALRRRKADQAAQRLLAGSWWREHDLVFTQTDGRPIDPRADYREWQAILSAAGLPPARVHAIRHTTATVLLELGEDLSVVQEVLGHADSRTTRGYQDVSTAMTRRAAARMDSVVGDQPVTDLVTERARRRALG